MNAREYLKQSFKLNETIKTDLHEIQQLKDLCVSVSPGELKSDPVQSSGNKDILGSTIIKIVDLEAKIDAEVDRLVELKAEIRERIGEVKNDTLRLVLQKRYLNFDKWERIAVDMNFDYRWILRLHDRAIEEFEKHAIKSHIQT